MKHQLSSLILNTARFAQSGLCCLGLFFKLDRTCLNVFGYCGHWRLILSLICKRVSWMLVIDIVPTFTAQKWVIPQKGASCVKLYGYTWNLTFSSLFHPTTVWDKLSKGELQTGMLTDLSGCRHIFTLEWMSRCMFMVIVILETQFFLMHWPPAYQSFGQVLSKKNPSLQNPFSM